MVVSLSCPSKESWWPGPPKDIHPLPTSHASDTQQGFLLHSDTFLLHSWRRVTQRGLVIPSMLLLLWCTQKVCGDVGRWATIAPVPLPSTPRRPWVSARQAASPPAVRDTCSGSLNKRGEEAPKERKKTASQSVIFRALRCNGVC